MVGAPRLISSGEGGRWLCRRWSDNAALLAQAMTHTHAPTQLEPGFPAPDSNMPATGKAMRRVYIRRAQRIASRGVGWGVGALGAEQVCTSAGGFLYYV